MRPYHQGQLDFFCAAYAAINALDYLYGMPLARSRDIFASTLEDLAALPGLWQAVLRNHTDFYWLPPYMLARTRSRYALSLNVVQPFPGRLFRPEDTQSDPLEPGCLDLEKADHVRSAYDCQGLERDQVWDLIQAWFSEKPDGRCMLLRFRRYLPYADDPVVQHWTAADGMRGEELLFRDASRDPGAIFSLHRDSTDISALKGVRKQLLVLEPPSILLLERTA
jgi:hypothetical protein